MRNAFTRPLETPLTLLEQYRDASGIVVLFFGDRVVKIQIVQPTAGKGHRAD